MPRRRCQSVPGTAWHVPCTGSINAQAPAPAPFALPYPTRGSRPGSRATGAASSRSRAHPRQARAAHFDANAPTPTITRGSSSFTIDRNASSHASSICSRSTRTSLSGVMFAPLSAMNASGHQFHTNPRAKKRSGVSNSRAINPQNRRPLTSLRVHAKPSIGRFGCTDFGARTFASIPRKSRTAATSPNGTPVCAMPKGPGFMPRNSASTPRRANAR